MRPAWWVLAGIAASLLVLWAWWGFFGARASGADTAFDIARLAIAGLAVVVVGAGITLFFRRQLALEQQVVLDRSRADVDRSRESRAARADLHARYQQAAGQLGHATPTMRIAGVYALEALAQEWAALGERTQRDACIDLLCGYVRTTPALTRGQGPDQKAALDAGEAEVRQTIVAVIARHLHDAAGAAGDWSNHDYSFSRGVFAHARFTGGHFQGQAAFDGAQFLADAAFADCHFAGEAEFDNARFTAAASFEGATFAGGAAFNGVTFGGAALFDNSSFPKIAWFNGTTFLDEAWFDRAAFGGGAGFDGATFHGETGFSAATFASVALFDNSRFAEVTHFDNVTLTDKTRFSGASMARGVPPELAAYVAGMTVAPMAAVGAGPVVGAGAGARSGSGTGAGTRTRAGAVAVAGAGAGGGTGAGSGTAPVAGPGSGPGMGA